MRAKYTKTIVLQTTPEELRKLADKIEKKVGTYPPWITSTLCQWKIKLASNNGLVVYLQPDLLAINLARLNMLDTPRETKDSER